MSSGRCVSPCFGFVISLWHVCDHLGLFYEVVDGYQNMHAIISRLSVSNFSPNSISFCWWNFCFSLVIWEFHAYLDQIHPNSSISSDQIPFRYASIYLYDFLFLIYIHQVQFALPTHSCTCSLLSVCGSLARSCTVKADLVRVSDSSFTAFCKLLKLLWSSIYSSINKQHQTYLCMPAIWVLEQQRQQPPEFKSCLDQTIQETLSQKQEGDTVLTCQIYYREL